MVIYNSEFSALDKIFIRFWLLNCVFNYDLVSWSFERIAKVKCSDGTQFYLSSCKQVAQFDTSANVAHSNIFHQASLNCFNMSL